MAWYGVITDAGKTAIENHLASGVGLNLNLVKTGTGTVERSQMTSVTDMVAYADDGSIIGKTGSPEGAKVEISIESASTRYVMKEIGIFATLQDNSTVLIAYYNDDDIGVEIPTVEDFPDFNFTLFCLFDIINSEDLTITIDPSAYVTMGKVKNDLTTPSTDEGYVLDARQGKVLNDKIAQTYPSNTGVTDQFLRKSAGGGAYWADPASSTEIKDAVEDWLDENLPQGETLVVDPTLSISQAAADAKVTGDNLSSLKSAILDKFDEVLNGVDYSHQEETTTGFHEMPLGFTILSGTTVEVYNDAEETDITAIFKDSSGEAMTAVTINHGSRKSITLTLDAVKFRSYVNGTEWNFRIVYGDNINGKMERFDEVMNNTAGALQNIKPNVFAWENGTFASATGADYSSTTRCRMRRLPKNDLIVSVLPSDGWKVEVLGYNGDTYLGIWNGETFEKFANFVTGKPIPLNVLPATRFKIVVGKTDDSTITVDDIADSLVFCSAVDYSAEEIIIPNVNRYYPTGDYSVGDTVSLVPVTPTSTTRYRGIYTPCKANDIFIVSGYGGNRGRAWALLDNDYKLLSISNGLQSYKKYIVEADRDGWFVSNAEVNQTYPFEITHITSKYPNDEAQKNEKEITRIKYGLPESVSNSIPATTLLYHAMWDDLVTKGLVTRSEATYMTGDTDHIYPLYTYTIAGRKKYMAGNYSVANDLSVIYDRPQALIISGQHGDEIVTPYILFKFIERMLTDPNYQGLLTEFDWTIVPLVNPTGFNARTRNNADNININRDYNDTIGFQTEEAQYVRDVVISKQFRWALDMHQDPDDGKTSGDPRCGFISMNLKRSTETQEEYDKLHNSFCRFISFAGSNTDAKMCIENALENQGQTNFIWDSSNANTSTFKNYAAGTVGNTQHTDRAIELVATFETSTVCWWYSHETTTYSNAVVQYTNIYAEEIIRAMSEMMRN